MALKISNETKVGALVAIAITILILGYNFLKGKDLFSKEVVLYAKYESIDGLQNSNAITIKGMKVGRITNMKLQDNGKDGILVRFIVNGDVKIPKNSKAVVVSADILGTKAIELKLGDSRELVGDNDTLASRQEESLSDQVTSQILPVKVKAESLLASMDTVMIIVQSIFNPETRTSIQRGVFDMKETLHNINKLSNRMDIMVEKKLSVIMTNLSSITSNFVILNDSIVKMTNNATAITSAIAQSDLTDAINSAEKSLIQMGKVMEKIEKGEGSLGLLVNDDELYINLVKSTAELDSLLVEFQENPRKYLAPLGYKKKKVEKKEAKEASN